MAAPISEYALRGIQGDQVDRFNDSLASMFLVKIAPNCAIEAFARRKDADLRGALGQQSLTIALQWQYPSSGNDTRYTVKERNTTGEYLANYALGLQGQRPILERRIDKYTRLFHGNPPQAASEVRLDGRPANPDACEPIRVLGHGLRLEISNEPTSRAVLAEDDWDQ